MSITAETAKAHAKDPAVLCCRAEAGITIEPANLEDPAIFDELVDSGLLSLDGCLTIEQVLGAKLTKTCDSLCPLTADVVEGAKAASAPAEEPAFYLLLFLVLRSEYCRRDEILLSDSVMNCLSMSSKDLVCGAAGAADCAGRRRSCAGRSSPCCGRSEDRRGRLYCGLGGGATVRLMERLIFPFSVPMTMTLTV